MNTTEFKEKYPQYAHLEGDELWDKMTESFFEEGEVYVADPDREIIYHEAVNIEGIGEVLMENSAKTVWINSRGERGLLKERTIPSEESTTSYSMVILDFGADKKE